MAWRSEREATQEKTSLGLAALERLEAQPLQSIETSHTSSYLEAFLGRSLISGRLSEKRGIKPGSFVGLPRSWQS